MHYVLFDEAGFYSFATMQVTVCHSKTDKLQHASISWWGREALPAYSSIRNVRGFRHHSRRRGTIYSVSVLVPLAAGG